MAMKRAMSCFDASKAILVRLFLIGHNFLAVWRVTLSLQNELFWYLLLGNILIVVDGVYSVTKRRSLDSKWISVCFLVFLIITLPPIWLVELNRHGDFSAIFRRNSTFTLSADTIGKGIESILQTEVDPDTWVILIEESVVYMVIIGRWFLPRGDVTREQLSELLLIFIGMASDIMEVFALFGVDAVRLDMHLTYAILAVWSLSLFQFTFVITVRKADIERCESAESDEVHARIIRTEILSVVLGLLMQDGPFLVVRLYTITTYKLVTYSLLFFVLKNILILLLAFYRLTILCCSMPCCTRSQSSYKPDMNENEPEADESNAASALFVLPTFIAMSLAGKRSYNPAAKSKEANTEDGLRKRVVNIVADSTL